MNPTGKTHLGLKIGAVLLVAAVVGVTAYQRSRSKPADSAPVDIRGAPISSPLSTSGVAVVASVIDSNGMPVTPAPTPLQVPGFRTVGFEKLSSFGFDLSDELLLPGTNGASASTAIAKKIPLTVKALNDQAVALTGFMLPLKVEAGTVTEMLIMRDQSMCCYGSQPKMNEWVSVKMKKEGVKPLMDQPVTLVGTLRVGEMRENGYLTGIYHMDGERLVEQ